MTHLPTSGRVYVSTVVVLGLAMFFVYLPQVQFDQPLLLLGLLLLSSMSAALKVYLPLTTGGSTMSDSAGGVGGFLRSTSSTVGRVRGIGRW